MNSSISIGAPWRWAVFGGFVLVMLADVAHRFHLLKYGLAMVLTFIGASVIACLIATRNGPSPRP